MAYVYFLVSKNLRSFVQQIRRMNGCTCTLLLILLSGVLCSHPTRANTQVEVIADDDYPPFSYRDGLHVAGLYAIILQRVFDKMPAHYQISMKPVPWKRGLIMMREGTAFAIFPPYFFPDKRPYLEHYSLPLMKERVTLFCGSQYISDLKQRTGRHKPIWPDDFQGAQVGINPGYLLLGDDFWERHYDGFYRIEEGANNQKNLLKVAKGRMDCMVNSRLSVLWDMRQLIIKGQPVSSDDIIQVKILKEQQGFLAFSKDVLQRYPFQKDFMTRFNALLSEMQASGELQGIIRAFEEELETL